MAKIFIFRFNKIMYPINLYKKSNSQNFSFCGHCGSESIVYNGEKKLLTTETAFGRDIETLEFATGYVNENFPDVFEKKFAVGACSTGEDVWTLKMLMNDKPVKIIGFDLGKKTIEAAKNAVYVFLPPDSKRVSKFSDCDGYKDIFLAYNNPNMSLRDKKLFEMFHKKFAEMKLGKFSLFSSDKKIYKLKEYDNDCKFLNADINNLPSEIIQNKFQLFSFKNAFYHLLTDHNGVTREEGNPAKLRPMLKNIFTNINKILDNRGLFLMGENENNQCDNMDLVINSLKENGFEAIPRNGFQNIWKKVKNII